MITTHDYDYHAKNNIEYTLPEKVDSISFWYDRGRISVMINGQEIGHALNGASDFSIEIDNS